MIPWYWAGGGLGGRFIEIDRLPFRGLSHEMARARVALELLCLVRGEEADHEQHDRNNARRDFHRPAR